MNKHNQNRSQHSLLGFENDLFTPLFAISRTAGWIAHHLENRQSNRKLIRPANIYVGEKGENYDDNNSIYRRWHWS